MHDAGYGQRLRATASGPWTTLSSRYAAAATAAAASSSFPIPADHSPRTGPQGRARSRSHLSLSPPLSLPAQDPKGAEEPGTMPFFGLQHFKGHGLAASKRTDGLAPSIKALTPAETQMLHLQKGKSFSSNLPALWSEEPTAKRARQGAEDSGATEYTPQSSYIDISSPDVVDADGYVDAGESAKVCRPPCGRHCPPGADKFFWHVCLTFAMCVRPVCAMPPSIPPRCSELPSKAQRKRRQGSGRVCGQL